jgi:integrase
MSDQLTTTNEPTGVTLSDNARRYVRRSKAKNTVRTYGAAWREFEHFAAGRSEPSLPATPETVIEYLTLLADNGAKVSTIEVKLAAIAWAHRAAARPDPTVYEVVKATLAGIRRELRRAPAKKDPATLAEIRAMLATLDTATLKGKRDKAMLLVGFAGAFRRSELVALDVADVRINGKLQATVRQSKTDQEGAGLVKTIPAIGGDLCPVAALRDWLDTAGIASGPVFRRMDRHGNVFSGRLAPQSVALVVKDAAKSAGLDWRVFSGHSLRSGFITEAMDAGASDSDIMEQTGHKSVVVMRDYRKSSGVGATRAVLAVFGESGL